MLKSKKAKMIVAIMVAVMLAVSVCAYSGSKTGQVTLNDVIYGHGLVNIDGDAVYGRTLPSSPNITEYVYVGLEALPSIGTDAYGDYDDDEYDCAIEGSTWPFIAEVRLTVTNCDYACGTHRTRGVDGADAENVLICGAGFENLDR